MASNDKHTLAFKLRKGMPKGKAQYDAFHCLSAGDEEGFKKILAENPDMILSASTGIGELTNHKHPRHN